MVACQFELFPGNLHYLRMNCDSPQPLTCHRGRSAAPCILLLAARGSVNGRMIIIQRDQSISLGSITWEVGGRRCRVVLSSRIIAAFVLVGIQDSRSAQDEKKGVNMIIRPSGHPPRACGLFQLSLQEQWLCRPCLGPYEAGDEGAAQSAHYQSCRKRVERRAAMLFRAVCS